MTVTQRWRCHTILIAIAVALGLLVQGTDEVLFSKALGRHVAIDEPVLLLLQTLLTSMPLIALALQQRQHVVPWSAGLGMSVWLTWWWLQRALLTSETRMARALTWAERS